MHFCNLLRASNSVRSITTCNVTRSIPTTHYDGFVGSQPNRDGCRGWRHKRARGSWSSAAHVFRLSITLCTLRNITFSGSTPYIYVYAKNK